MNINPKKKPYISFPLKGCAEEDMRHVTDRVQDMADIVEKHRRDTQAVREFIVKTAIQSIIMVAILVLVWIITQTPIITNNISMHQMENSNDWFVAMIMYQKFATAAGIFGNVYVIGTLGFIGWDGYKLAKVIKSKPTNETEK